MNEVPRRKSPRAPSMPLEEAIDRALRAYDRERLHPAPTDVVAQHIGYKGANSGAALSALASLRYFGLLERPKEGMLAVSKAVESYKFSPDENMKKSLLVRFLKSPPLYIDLLEKYSNALPSDANLRYELIQRGFSPAAADVILMAFVKSVQYAEYFKDKEEPRVDQVLPKIDDEPKVEDRSISGVQTAPLIRQSFLSGLEEGEFDRIPVRLSGGRRAWLTIPVTFFKADKARLKDQIDLILTQDEED